MNTNLLPEDEVAKEFLRRCLDPDLQPVWRAVDAQIAQMIKAKETPIDQEAKARFLTAYLSPIPEHAEMIWDRLYHLGQIAYVPAGKRVAYYRLA